MAGPDLPPPDQPMSTHACLSRWPTAPTRTELIHGILLFADFGEQDAATTQPAYPGRRVLLSAEGHLEVQPASTGPPRSLLDR